MHGTMNVGMLVVFGGWYSKTVMLVLMQVKFVLWLISGVLLVLHGKMDTNANEDAFGDHGLVQNSCALQFVRRRLALCGVA